MESELVQKKYTPTITRRLAFIATFFVVTPLALVSSVFALVVVSDYKVTSATEKYRNSITNRKSGVHIYASLPSSTPTVSGYVISADARIELIHQFLAKYNSPLEPHAAFIVQTADKYSLDYRLITAIAMKESGLCKIIPESSHNCWGWGIHSKGTLGFDSYPEGIEAVSKGLKDNYVDIGLVTVDEIMSKYIPHSPGGAWATGVSIYMQQIN